MEPIGTPLLKAPQGVQGGGGVYYYWGNTYGEDFSRGNNLAIDIALQQYPLELSCLNTRTHRSNHHRGGSATRSVLQVSGLLVEVVSYVLLARCHERL